MSMEKDSIENQNTVEKTTETEYNETDSNLASVKHDVEDLSLIDHAHLDKNEESENVLETFGDEADGRVKNALKKIACGLKPKRSTNTEDIEPYSKNVDSWTNSKVFAENEVDDDVVKSDKAVTKDDNKIGNVSEDDSYKFTYQKRGYLLLVINETFYNQATRTGADLDLHKMKKIAKRFGFEILNKGAETNLTKLETLEWLQKAKSADHSLCDCFMFMISTHGLEQRNPRKGGVFDHALVCADDQLIFTSTIIEMFSDKNCPSLEGKPKIFIIQACRGTSVDHGSHLNITTGRRSSNVKDRKSESDQAMHVQYDVTDTKAAQDSWNNGESSDIETPCLKCDTDMLIMYAIPPGMLAWRNTVDGSWMIHYMHEILQSYDMKSPRSFLKVLTKISAKMALRSTDAPSIPDFHEKKAIPVIEHMLTRDILFALKR